jgi:hypothetical protein
LQGGSTETPRGNRGTFNQYNLTFTNPSPNMAKMGFANSGRCKRLAFDCHRSSSPAVASNAALAT